MNKHIFVQAAVAHQLLKKDYQILAVGSEQQADFQKQHLPGAVYFDTSEIESEANGWNFFSAAQCQKAFAAKGITAESAILIYSDNLNAACRVAFAAFWLGIDRVKILQDGLLSWEYPLEQGLVEARKAATFGAPAPKRPEILISTAEDLLAAKVRNPQLVLASVRSWSEYSGGTGGYTYIEQAGEPAGAVFVPASCGKDDVAELLTANQQLKPLTEIAQLWQAAGLAPEKEIVFYCGTGWRAATAFFVAQELGWPRVRLFDGGWYDWSKKHQANPERFPLKKRL